MTGDQTVPDLVSTARHRATPGPNYRWIALFISTLGMLMATIDSSIVLIALPDIFRGIGIDPLQPGNSFYLLWMILGFLVVTSGKPCPRSKRIWWPKTDFVPVPVRSALVTPSARMRRRRS